MAKTTSGPSSSKGAQGDNGQLELKELDWRPTKIMNMGDLSKDDDFLSHLLVEKLGTGNVPLYVHKMDLTRQLPKVSASDLLDIVRRLVVSKATLQQAIRQAVDDLLRLPAVLYYVHLQKYEQKQINAFATHASRYFELYQPGGLIEISHTSRYSHRTGKSELCILATKAMSPGTVITELKGSMANLTDAEDEELKRTAGIRRDFSVIHSKSMKKNHLFLGPARFVNHDCDNNCELFREGRYITFRVLRTIAIGEEITAHYGDGYFGKRNRHCLCETCEKKGRGGYAPDHDENDAERSDSSTDSSDEGAGSDGEGNDQPSKPNLDERRTRRGVYAVMSKEEDSDESEDEDENNRTLRRAPEIPAAVEPEADVSSDLTSLSSSLSPSDAQPIASTSLSVSTPARSSSSLSSLSSAADESISCSISVSVTQKTTTTTSSYCSIISTHRQKSQQEASSSTPQSVSLTPSKRVTRSTSTAQTSTSKGKGKGRATDSSISTPTRTVKGKEKEQPVKIKVEEVEPRILRTTTSREEPRISRTTTHRDVPRIMQEVPSQVKAPPRGADGKLLPLCITCKNVLPVISVDAQVIWGLGLEKKKTLKQECPRCMRHMAIYCQPWPRRVPLPGSTSSFVVTPREETPTGTTTKTKKGLSKKELEKVDGKLATTSSKRKPPRTESTTVSEPPRKRARLTLSLSPAKSKTKIKTKVSEKTEVQETSTVTVNVDVSISEAPPKRKRGRPRKDGKPVGSVSAPVVKVKMEEEEVLLHPLSTSQSSRARMPNGQFGVKTKALSLCLTTPHSPAKSREQRALEREKLKAKLDNESSVGKNQGVDELEENRSGSVLGKRGRGPTQKMFPKPSVVGRANSGHGLLSRPNPMRLAIQAWTAPLVTDEDALTSEEEKAPDTPEDSASSPAVTIVGVDAEGMAGIKTVPGALTFKPNPMTFAQRRWSSHSSSRTSTEERERPESLDMIVESLPTPTSSTEVDSPSVSGSGTPVRIFSKDAGWEVDEDLQLHFEPPPFSPIQYPITTTIPATNLRLDTLRKTFMKPRQPILVSTKFPNSNIYESGSAPVFVDAGWEEEMEDIDENELLS